MKSIIIVIGMLVSLQLWAGVDEVRLEEAVAGSHRTLAYVARDVYRHPAETLSFFDIQPQHTVVEVWPGGGWYTEILAPYLRNSGLLIAAHYDSGDTQASYRPSSRKSFEDKMASAPDVYDEVQVTSLSFDEKAGTLAIGAADADSVDRVVTFRNAHGWRASGTTDAAFAHFFAILKTGGKLGIVQHRADPEQDWTSRNIGYVGREYMLAAATSAGFELHSEGFFNANPLDNKRYTRGVWQLPPSYSDTTGEEARAPFKAIGESDRMTLVFVKP
ncbi:MAG: putative methyltransferase [Halieaceae bacterium]|jgi:predicted methyltransferase